MKCRYEDNSGPGRLIAQHKPPDAAGPGNPAGIAPLLEEVCAVSTETFAFCVVKSQLQPESTTTKAPNRAEDRQESMSFPAIANRMTALSSAAVRWGFSRLPFAPATPDVFRVLAPGCSGGLSTFFSPASSARHCPAPRYRPSTLPGSGAFSPGCFDRQAQARGLAKTPLRNRKLALAITRLFHHGQQNADRRLASRGNPGCRSPG